MKIKLNKNIICDVYEGDKQRILDKNMVYCYQVKCLDNDDISCNDCLLTSSGYVGLCIEYDKVKVED